MPKAQSNGVSGDVPNGKVGKQLGSASSVRPSPGKTLSDVSSPYPSSPSASSSPAKVRWANTRGAQRRQDSSAPATPIKDGNAVAKLPIASRSDPVRQKATLAGRMRPVSEEGGIYEEDEDGEEEERETDEIVEPEEIPTKKLQPATLVAPKSTPKPGVAKIPRQPTVDLGSRSAGAAHYGPNPTNGKRGPRRAGVWKDGAVNEQLLEQQKLDESAVEKKAHKGKGAIKKPLKSAGGMEPDDQDDLLEWGTLDSSLSSPFESDQDLTPMNAKRQSSLLRVQHRTQEHLLLTHNRARPAGNAVEGSPWSPRPAFSTRQINVYDHVIAVRGGEELKAIVSDISKEGEVSVVWEDGVSSTIKLVDIRDIAVKVSDILAGDRILALRDDGATCTGLVKRMEDGIVFVDWFDGSGVDCRVDSKDILKVFDIDEDDEDVEEDAAVKDAPRSDSDEFKRSSTNKLEAVQRAEANRTRASVRMARKVAEAINVIPMNQDLTWSEFSRSCYDRFGRIHIHECHCGGNYCGMSGLCRRCGKKRGHHLPRGGATTENICWTDDLYELASVLLDKESKLNHSQKQYALRAVAQRLKTPTWDWKGPGTALKSAVDAQCSELVYVMLQGGVDPNEADARGVSPLHAASFLGRADICRLLLDGEAKVNILDRHGQSPLFFAPNLQVCRMLCGFNADLNVVNDYGQTALHFVARAGIRDVLQWFQQRSSKSLNDLKDGYGVTAAQYMVLSCPEIADDALTPGSHCFTNPAMRPGPFTGHHRLPEPRWELYFDDERASTRGSSRASSRASSKQRANGKMSADAKSP